ncbi:MAG: 3-deoxy-D-manno-octulosonic acid transferase [Candidatus Omnitrophica bacterium]|nr:3-deoxy-D-manno-octulosonic acid transferase [Candidatus Omnitrophota bacterium]
MYDFIFFIFALFSIPKFLIRLGQAASRKELIAERFGFFSKSFGQKFIGRKTVWLHAVSVGEVQAAREWIRLFLERYPDWQIALSVTTPTGRQVAETLASERVFVFYAPFDFSFVVRNTFATLQPKLILLMETELWPNLISQAESSSIPIGIMNGRLSPRSFQRYFLFRYWMRPILEKLSFCLVQSERDRDYFAKLGMPPLRIFYTGNMKFDQFDSSIRAERGSSVRKNSEMSNRLILVGGSTHWGEEKLLLGVFRRLQERFQNLKLILAPRHPENLPKIMTLIKSFNFEYQLFSEEQSGISRPVLLIDRMGVLASLYPSADLVFMGGSFVKRGGQSPIEPASSKKPLLHGPLVFNFREIYQMLDEKEAAFQVTSEEELFQKSRLLLENPKLREQMGTRAWSCVQSMKGATARTLDFLASWICLQEEPSVAVAQSL